MPPPLTQEITPSSLGKEWDGVISCFLQELQSLVVLINEDNKCNGLNENHCKRKEVFICNHFTTPFALTLGFLQGGSIRPPLVVSLPGHGPCSEYHVLPERASL